MSETLLGCVAMALLTLTGCSASAAFCAKCRELMFTEGDAVAQIGKTRYQPLRHAQPVVGSGGLYCTEFKAVLSLQYRRPWEKDQALAQRFRATIQVIPETTPPAPPEN